MFKVGDVVYARNRNGSFSIGLIKSIYPNEKSDYLFFITHINGDGGGWWAKEHLQDYLDCNDIMKELCSK